MITYRLPSLRLLVYIWLLTCARFLVTGQSSSDIPRLYVKGSYYEIGFQVGSKFQEYIRQYFQDHPDLHAVWLPWSKTPEGQKILEDFDAAARKYFPQYVRELLGIAHGANVNYEEVFLMNYDVELSAMVSNKTSPHPDSCSTLLVNHPQKNTVIIGHNEDNSPLIQNRSYIITATVIEEGHVLEQFTGYCYPGTLPGRAFGFNSHGIITTVNGLYPKLVLKGKVGRNFINRAMLAARSFKDALSKAGTPGAYGFSCNIGLVGTTADSQPCLFNLEVAPDAQDQRTEVRVMEVLPSVEMRRATIWHNISLGNYFHVNMYRRFVLPQIPDRLTSSIHRTKRIEEFPKPTTMDDVKMILGDSKDSKFPIYRSPRPTDNETTLATAFFDLQRCMLFIFTERPSKGGKPSLSIDIPCTKQRACQGENYSMLNSAYDLHAKTKMYD